MLFHCNELIVSRMNKFMPPLRSSKFNKGFHYHPIQEQEMVRVKMRIPKDGNCFFHCIATIIHFSHTEIRRRCVKYLHHHREFCQEWGISQQDTHNLNENGTWYNDAMDIMPLVASNVFGIAITINDTDSNQTHQIVPERNITTRTKPISINLLRHHDHYELESR